MGAFVHNQGLDNYPLYVDDYYNTLGQQNNRANYPRTIDFCMQQPRYMALSGTRNFSPFGNIILVSSDGGTTWAPTAALPPNISASTPDINDYPQAPRLAYSSSTPGVFLISRTNGEPCLTVNNGSSFITSSSSTIPGSDYYFQFSWKFTLVPDRVNGNKFYYINDTQLWMATWNGSTSSPSYTWQLVNSSTGLRNYYEYQGILSSPTTEGHLWFYSNSTEYGATRLSKSTDGGATITPLPGFDKVIVAALGKGSGVTGDASYTAYALASRNNVFGIYQSVDLGNTWKRLDITNSEWANNPNCMGASLQNFGEVFVGTNGSGVCWLHPSSLASSNSIMREDSTLLVREDNTFILREG